MIGKDLTLCACCGGYYFKIKNDTFLAKEYVESNIFNSEELLPKKVKIKYAKVEDKCSSGKDVIKITAIKRD